MLAICTNNSAFEDQLNTDQSYFVIELKGESVQIINESGDRRWYGLAGKFRLGQGKLNRLVFEKDRRQFDSYHGM